MRSRRENSGRVRGRRRSPALAPQRWGSSVSPLTTTSSPSSSVGTAAKRPPFRRGGGSGPHHTTAARDGRLRPCFRLDTAALGGGGRGRPDVHLLHGILTPFTQKSNDGVSPAAKLATAEGVRQR